MALDYLRIPNEIYQTTAFPREVVPDLLGVYRRKYGLHIYSDIEARSFMAKYYGDAAAAAFELLSGPNRGDMFRYAVLYQFGGLCLDIKTVGWTPIDEIFPNVTDKLSFYTVLSTPNSKGRWIHNSIIAAPPRHPLILKEFNFTFQMARRHHHTVDTVLHFMGELQKRFGKLKYGGVYETKDMRLILHQEECSTVTDSLLCRLQGNVKDRYGKCCAIFRTNDTSQRPLFLTRDPTYPAGWTKRMQKAKLDYTYSNVTVDGRETLFGRPKAGTSSARIS